MNPIRSASKYVFTASIIVLVIISASACWAQANQQDSTIRSFLDELVGEWVGTCEQQMEDEKPDKQYFHVTLKRLEDGSFEGKFKFFRQEKDGLIPSGETSVITNLDNSGSAISKITGSGKVMLSDKLTDQRHELTETLHYSKDSGLQSQGTGKISVSGTLLGIGKNGQVKESKSVWSVKDGVLNIDQQMKVSFKALFVTKNYGVQTHYTARRGNDVSALLNTKPQITPATPGGCGAGAVSQD